MKFRFVGNQPKPSLDSKSITLSQKKRNFEKYMHAFMSLISLEKIGCSLEEQVIRAPVCRLSEEKGWLPKDYLELHLKMLNILFEKNFLDKTFQENFRRFVILQIVQTKRLIHFINTDYSKHATLIRKYLKNSGSYILYPWGPADHQVYFEFWHRSNGEYWMTISDLGAGRTGEIPDPISNNIDQYGTLIRKFSSAAAFFHFFQEVIIPSQNQIVLDEKAFKADFDLLFPDYYFVNKEEYNKAFKAAYEKEYTEAAIEFYSSVYGDRNVCVLCLSEIGQTTGNCVVKNLMAASKKDAMDQFKYPAAALNIFRNFYMQLLKTTLREAEKNSIYLQDPLPELSAICDLIKESQLSFFDVDCRYIKRYLAVDYQNLITATTPPQPALDHEFSSTSDFSDYSYGGGKSFGLG